MPHEVSTVFKSRSVRSRLILLLLIALVPSMGVQAVLHFGMFADRQTHELRVNTELARAASATLEEYIEDILNQEALIARALAQSDQWSAQQFDLLLDAGARARPSEYAFMLVKPEGDVLASSHPERPGIDLSQSAAFQAVVAGEEWAVSDLSPGLPGGKPMFAILRRVQGNTGTLKGILAVIVNPAGLGNVLQLERAGQGSATIIDRQGRIVYRYPETPTAWEQLNTAGAADLVASAMAGQGASGPFVRPVDGQKRIAGYVPIRSIGWVAGASVPESEAMASVSDTLLRGSSMVLIVAIASLIAALAVGHSLTAPLSRIKRHAQALARGERGQLAKIGGPRELDELAVAINRMADEVRFREEQLRESEERYRSLAEAARDLIFVVDRSGVIEYINSFGARHFGLLVEEIIGKRQDELFPQELAERHVHNLQAVVQTGQSLYEELQTPFPGCDTWLGTWLAPLTGEKGDVRAVLGISRDITERKKAEQAMLTQFKQFSAIFDSINAVVYASDLESYELLHLNRYGVELFGDQNLGRPCYEVLQSGQTQRCPFCTNDRLVRNGVPEPPHAWEFQNTVTGRWFLCIDRAITWDDGRLVRMEVAVDITERKQVEDSFRKLAESSPIGIYIIQHGKFKYVNVRFQQYTGYSEEELLAMTALRLVIPEDRDMVRDRAIQMLKGERHTPYEYRITDKAGNSKWILETMASITYAGERAAVGSFMDITERRNLEEQLAHLAAHDPLTGLLNRRALEDAMNRAGARARRAAPGALLFLDLDNFKEVNDTLGHAAGDEVLVMVARLLQEQLRTEDILVRLGGDEFAVLLDGTEGGAITVVAERMLRAIDEFLFCIGQSTFHLSLSIGAVAIEGQKSSTALLSQADAAMYRAKEQGGNRIVLY